MYSVFYVLFHLFFQLPLIDKLLAQMILLDKVVKTKVLGAPTAPNKGGVLTLVAVVNLKSETTRLRVELLHSQ